MKSKHVRFKRVKDNVWNEWIIRVWVDGVRAESRDYHTDDRDDAVLTMESMITEEVWLSDGDITIQRG